MSKHLVIDADGHCNEPDNEFGEIDAERDRASRAESSDR